jgi:cytochrome c5
MSEHASHEHTSFIKTPKQLIAVVVLAFIVPIFVISMLASLAFRSAEPPEGAFSEEAVAKRIKPVGEVVVAAAPAAAGQRSGQDIVQTTCSACHGTGALGAPKIGDKAAWGPLIKEGLQNLTQIAIKGIRQMPPRGGNPDLSDAEVGRAVAYMANQAGAQFSEPAGSSPAAPGAANTAATPATSGAPAAAAATPATSGAPAAATAAPAAATAATPAGKGAPAAAAAGGASNGKAVFESTCVVCHGTGVAGAPKIGDKEAWGPRIKQGADTLHQSALKGKNAMPPKGGNASLSDADVMAAVDYMVGQSK